ncbi:MAG TPA: 3-hydroxyacyl-CoA dehydrogenase NAD-binding domain-containing protein, partial [Candidatus Dormibacteraeota bacterium]|nr:3-hydroxyacyl-CoA dehydrogenase NAD-binding domain-containing protein [Candidatus Dormibacteraeota bacterium]
MSEIVGVVGAGTMGSGIAQEAARAGYEVVMRDVAQEFLLRGMTTIDKSLQRGIDKQRLRREDKRATMARIRTTTDIGVLKEAFIVIEAVTEDLPIKVEVFKSLDEVTRPEAVLASNTSSISITKLAAATRRPDKVIGMHFSNPVPVMKLVEIIRGMATSDDTHARVVALAEKLGKTPLECQDSP